MNYQKHYDKLSNEQRSSVLSESVKTSWEVLSQSERSARAKQIWEKRRMNGNAKQSRNR